MGDLTKLELKTAYHKGLDDIAYDFYLPCMSSATHYDRAVSFFNSTIYIIAWPSLKDFVQRGGRMRIVCSPLLSSEDISSISEGYSRRAELDVGKRLRSEIQSMLQDPYLRKPTQVLASLVALKVLSFKIVFFDTETGARHRRLFHDKLGIFMDEHANKIVFKGSMNETWAGLSSAGNLESVDVYVSWAGDRDAKRVSDEVEYFSTLWEDRYPSVTVREFPEIAYTELLKAAKTQAWPELVDSICLEIDHAQRLSADRQPGGRVPRPHQINALLKWFDLGRRGILDHATGAGKTFTALCAIRDSLERQEIPVVLVPSELLLKQWYAEILQTFQDVNLQILQCGGGNSKWQQNRLLHLWTRESGGPRIVLSTIQSASTHPFLDNVAQGRHLFVIADEVHRLGSPVHQRLLQLESGPRLGLSATPRRAGDPDGTNAIFEYFGGIIPPPFTLKDAIESGALTPYMYYVHTVLLSEHEQESWDALTSRIQQLYAQYYSDPDTNRELLGRVKSLLIERARIVKGAQSKVPAAVEVVSNYYRSEERQRWIVYCDSQQQLYEVLRTLRRYGYSADEYHSNMPGDRDRTLRHFELNGGILVSIRCLDEGVDIPSVTHALILASSKNPREFIQRRGRVLRRAPNKGLAFVHDVLVLPRRPVDQAPPTGAAILHAEMARALEFSKSALNPSAIVELRRIAIRYDTDIESLVEEGYEDEED